MTYKKCYPSWIRTNPKCTKNICATATPSGNMEQIAGIEPTSPTWKEGVITIIRYLLMWASLGSNQRPTDYESGALTN